MAFDFMAVVSVIAGLQQGIEKLIEVCRQEQYTDDQIRRSIQAALAASRLSIQAAEAKERAIHEGRAK